MSLAILFHLLYTQNDSDVSLQHGHYSNPAAPHLKHTTTENKTADVVIQQHSRKLLMMDVLMSETC